MIDLLEINFRLIGISQILLALLHIGFEKRFGWKEDLAALSLLNRQLFVVHTFFVALTILLVGCISLFGARDLIISSPLGIWVTGGLFVFWLARLYCQFWVFDKRSWMGHKFNGLMHVLFIFNWTWYSVSYGLVFLNQIGLISIATQ
jgi:hypothetical protein